MRGQGSASASIGVLDLQGDVREHLAALADVGSAARLVKRPADLDGLDGLMLPGGESTTLSMLLESTGLFEALCERLSAAAGSDGLPILGTCAGLVLVAREVLDGRPDQRTFGVLDAVVRRNGYGRQVQSFESEVRFGSGEGPPLPAVFIRAPLVVSVGEEVDVLATLDGVPVLVRQGHVLGSSFHPELTPDRRVHAAVRADLRRGRRPRRGPAPVADGMRRYVLTITCPDRVGIVAAVTGLIAGHGGSVLEAAQHGDLQTGRFFLRIEIVADSLPAGFGPEELARRVRAGGGGVRHGVAPERHRRAQAGRAARQPGGPLRRRPPLPLAGRRARVRHPLRDLEPRGPPRAGRVARRPVPLRAGRARAGRQGGRLRGDRRHRRATSAPT